LCGHSLEESGEDGLLASLLGQDGSRLVLRVRVVGQLRRTGGDGALEEGLLQVVEHLRVLFGEERQGHAALTRATRTTDTMDVICRRTTRKGTSYVAGGGGKTRKQKE